MALLMAPIFLRLPLIHLFLHFKCRLHRLKIKMLTILFVGKLGNSSSLLPTCLSRKVVALASSLGILNYLYISILHICILQFVIEIL
jgi:hypothetical protein